jgi:hypothetical protein
MLNRLLELSVVEGMAVPLYLGGGELIWLKSSCRAGVFNLSDSAGHINNFNDARGPQSYTAAFRIVSCFPVTQRTTYT